MNATAGTPVSEPEPRALPPRRDHWPADALAATRELQRDLDSWCREHGLSGRLNPVHAETAVREAWAADPPAWQSVDIVSPIPVARDLPGRLASWPAEWRYRVAELERSGATRADAVRRARAERRRTAAEAA